MASHVFPFLQLPAEIRLPIYRLMLPNSEYHKDSVFERQDCPVKWHRGDCPGILFVSRQIHQEATEVLYRENTFAIYVRHPRAPRLSMGEGRADPESFMLVSWANRTWDNPRNPILPLSVLRNHPHLQSIRRLHVSLPRYGGDLSGVDMFMKRTSYAAFHGIDAWVSKCLKAGGRIDSQERERMNYFQQFKKPIDEIGELLQELPQMDQLCLTFQTHPYDIPTTEYLLQGILKKRGIANARCFYVRGHWGGRLEELQYFVDLLQSPIGTKTPEKSHLPSDMDGMYLLLETIRRNHERDPSFVPPFIKPMVR